jgi:hypothetical protein
MTFENGGKRPFFKAILANWRTTLLGILLAMTFILPELQEAYKIAQESQTPLWLVIDFKEMIKGIISAITGAIMRDANVNDAESGVDHK